MLTFRKLLSVLVITALVLTGIPAVYADQANMPENWNSQDIGDVGLKGTAVYANQQFSVTGSGSDIWESSDAFHYAYQEMTGDGQIVARVVSMDDTDGWAKAGVMMRETLDSGSVHASSVVTISNGCSFQRRSVTGEGSSDSTPYDIRETAPYWVKVIREGNQFTAYRSEDGVKWSELGSQQIKMADKIYVGLAVTAHNNSAANTSKFDNVKIGPVEYPEEIMVKKLELDDPTKLYVLENASGVTPQIALALRNGFKKDIKGSINISLTTRGSNVAWQGSIPFEIKANEFKEIKTPITAVKQADYYEANIDIICEGSSVGKAMIPFGVVRPAANGVRENSPFGLGLANSGEFTDNILIAEKMGVKWIRGIADEVDPPVVNPEPGKFWDKATIDKVRAKIMNLKDHGISCLGYVNYNMDWNVEPIPGRESYGRHENRPHDMEAHAEMVYQMIKPLSDLVKYWELWNEPWIHSWTWNTGTAQDYRDMTKLIWDKVKPEMPDVMLIGGGSVTFNRDIEYAKGSKDIGYIDGSVSHAYGVPDANQLANTKLQKEMDKLWSKSQGIGGMWQTELGTSENDMFGNLPETERKWAVARTVAPTYLLQMLGAGDTPVHVFWFSLSYANGFSGDSFNMYDARTRSPKPVVMAYSAMTHFLEDSKLVGEMYPNSKSLWSFLFERKDGKATAAIYADRDFGGKVTIHNSKGIKVYDYLGTELADGKSNNITVDLKPWETVYLVSDSKPEKLRTILKTAKFDMNPAVKVSPLSFTSPVSDKSTIDVKLENVSPDIKAGKLKITAPEGWTLKKDEMPVALKPGEITTVSFPVEKSKVNDINRYPIKYSLTFAGSTSTGGTNKVEGQQTIQVACAPFKTITVDGSLDDWKEVMPVTMVSSGSRNYLETVLDPSKVKDIVNNNNVQMDDVVYTAKTAWDDDNFYFMAQIPDAAQSSNKPFPDDLYAFPFWADSVELAFDCIGKNPDDILYGDPYYEKSCSSDMDYEFIATLAQGNVSELHRQCAPGTNYQTYYPTNADLDPKLGTMDATENGGTEGKIKIMRDDANKLTTYEIAVSWKSISELYKKLSAMNPGSKVETNFAFSVNDNGNNSKGTSYWTKEAGQLESGTYNFAPFWGSGTKDGGGRVITRWGFIK